MQKQKYFFGVNDPWNRAEPSQEEKKWKVSRANKDSPFHAFIGNDKAIQKLQVVAYDALGKDNHLCNEIAFSIFGPPSSGKTTLVKIFAKVLDLPFIEFGPQIKNTEDILKEIERVLSLENVPLVEFKRRNYFEMPPCVIFIDEIHAVADNVIQALLKATEFNDSMMVTEKGKTINCKSVCWMIATTDEGMLFDAFRSRFSPLVLTYLNDSDISKIIKLANPDVPYNACDLIAYYNSRVPRKALEFARFVKMKYKMFSTAEEQVEEYENLMKHSQFRGILNHLKTKNENFELKPEPKLSQWLQVIENARIDEGVDSYGMQEVHRKVLQALCKSPIAMSRMSLVVGRKKEEVERYVMPWLMTETGDSKALVTVTHKGYDLTESGRAACLLRGFLSE